MTDYDIKRVSSNKFICEADDYKCPGNAYWKVSDNVLEIDYWYCQKHLKIVHPALWAKVNDRDRVRRGR